VHGSKTRKDPAAGFSLLECLSAAGLIMIGFLGVASALMSNTRAYARAREDVPAIHALRELAETVRNAPFGQVASTYQGTTYSIPDLGATATVTIFVNETDTSPDAAVLGLPRDLDGDGAASTVDVTNRYFLLPIKVSVSWTGREGPETRNLYTMLAQERG
jgi:Tfp pilus assembly protein PilV